MKLPLAHRYEHFLTEVYGSSVTESELLPEPLSEQTLQSHWFAGDFGKHFITTEGQRVELKDYGYWNSGPGPDFTDCALLLDGKECRGSIELDPDVRDWEHHGHSTNEDYDKTILHLYLTASPHRSYTRTSSHHSVPQVQLSLAALTEVCSSKPGALAAARLGRCAQPLAHMPQQHISSLLESAAQHRLARKSQRLERLISAQGRDQALYQALAITLGYKSNTAAFQLLAQRAPLRTVLKMADKEREALLFGLAGYTEDTPFDEAKADTRGYLRALWEHWWKQRSAYARWLQPQQRLPWKKSTSRPGNHPQRRLAALATVIQHWGRVSHPLHQPDKWQRSTWTQLLVGLKHDYWSSHYTLLSAPAKQPIALIGHTRVQEMLANVVYPLLIPEREALWAEYLELPALLANQKVERALLRLFGPGHPLAKTYSKRLFHHQGLLQVYEDFCLEDHSSCADCPFPEQLSRWPL